MSRTMSTSTHNRWMIVMVLILVSAMAQMVSAVGEQTWYFTGTEASGPISSGNPDYNKIMTKEVEGENVVITLAPGERVWFYADQLAQCDVRFPKDKWSVTYWVKALNSGEAGQGCVYNRLCYIDSTGTPTTASSSNVYEAITNPQNIEEIEEGWFADNDVLAFTVPEGGRLAIEVLWGSEPLGNLEIHCNPSGEPVSKVTSPSTDPGYPVPELPTLILFSAGLLILAGYAYMGRRNK